MKTRDGREQNSKIPDPLGFSRHMKTRLLDHRSPYRVAVSGDI